MPFDHALWKRRIDTDSSEQARRHAQWKRNLELYDMSYWKNLGFQGSMWSDTIIPVNYIPTFVSTKVSAIYSRNPKLFVRGRYDRYATFAQLMEDVLERYWDEQDLKSVFINVIRDSVIFGIGWIECGYLETVERQVEPEVKEQTSLMSELKEVMGRLIGKESESAPEPISTQGILNVHQREGQFFCQRRSPYDVFIPAGFSDMDSLPYLIVRDRLRFEDFASNPRYKHVDQVSPLDLKTNVPSPGKLQSPRYEFKSPGGASVGLDMKIVDLYHVWDRREMTMTSMTRGVSDPHDGPNEWPYFSEGFPVAPLTFNAIPNTPEKANAYPFSDLEPIIGQVLEKSMIRTQASQHRKRANSIIIVQKGSSTETDVKNYAQASGAVDVVPVANIQAIQQGPPITLSPIFFQMEEMCNSDLDRDSGLQLILADLQRSAQIDRATVASIAQGNASLKVNYSVDRIEMFSKQIAKFHVGMFWQFLTRQRVGEMIGYLPGEEEWPSLPAEPHLARQRIQSELELRIEAGSTRPIQDDVLDRQQFLSYIRIFQAVSPQKFQQVENQVLALMAKKFREPSLEAVILSAINQDHIQEAEQENQFLLQGFPQVVRPSDDHEAHLQSHGRASQTPVHQMQAQESVKRGQVHPLDQHILQHAQARKGQQGAQQNPKRQRGANRQGVSQQAQAPSATELSRGGTPQFSDLAGQAMNLRAGTGSQPFTG